MIGIEFKSRLAPYIQGLLDQKRALGFKYDVEEYVLGRFDKYWLETNGNSEDVTIESLAGWCRQLPTEGKSSQAMRISVVRQLALYMNGQGCLHPHRQDTLYAPHRTHPIPGGDLRPLPGN